jgi:hypothetical protein
MSANPIPTTTPASGNTDIYRRLTALPAGRSLTRSRLFRQALLAKNYISSRAMAWREPDAFRELRALALFIGHNKSGTSLVGALLDAHPDAVVADDMDALRFVSAGFSRAQLCHLLAAGARRDLEKGRVTARRVEAYSYLVPGGWQGRYRRGLVLGDATSGSTTRRLGEDPALLDRLRALAGGAAVRFVFVIRNPFDPISYIMVRGNRSFENAIDHYFTNCATVQALRRRLPPEDVLAVHYEPFVTQFDAQLRRVCAFMGLEPDPDYLAACAAIVRPAPQRDRDRVVWDAAHRLQVVSRMADFDFLDGYTFEGET